MNSLMVFDRNLDNAQFWGSSLTCTWLSVMQIDLGTEVVYL